LSLLGPLLLFFRMLLALFNLQHNHICYGLVNSKCTIKEGLN
jgi:hypothetical protein